MPRLSKSRFIAGWQCPLRLWYTVHEPKLAPPVDERQQAIFDSDHRIGELAQRRYPGGQLIDADYRQTDEARFQTRDRMLEPHIPALYEPAIEHDKVLTRVDVLARAGEAWDLIEVKSSTKAKAVFKVDVAVQYWILAGAGVPVNQAGLLVLNRDYVYEGGDYDLNALFRFVDLTETCEAWHGWVWEQVAQFHAIADDPILPAVEPGSQCHSPCTCPFLGQCLRGFEPPANPIEMGDTFVSHRDTSL